MWSSQIYLCPKMRSIKDHGQTTEPQYKYNPGGRLHNVQLHNPGGSTNYYFPVGVECVSHFTSIIHNIHHTHIND